MKKNELKSGVILSYIGMIANIIVQLFFTPIILRYLGQNEYGIYTLVASVVNYLSLCSLGFGASYLRFFSRIRVKNDEEELANFNGMYLLLFLVFSCIALVFGIFLTINSELVFGNNLSFADQVLGKRLLIILTVNISITMFTTVFNSMISAYECFIFQKVVILLSIVINPIVTFPALFLGGGSLAIVIIMTSISFICLIVDIWYCVVKLKLRFAFNRMNFSLLKEMGVFSFFLLLNAIIDQINWSVDKLLIGRIIGTVEVAIYGVASQINNLYLNLSTAVSGVFAPKVNMMVAEDVGDEKLTDLLISVGRVQFIILALVASGFCLFGKFFVYLWAGKGYESAYYMALFLILPLTIPLIQNVGVEIQRAKNKHQFRSIIYLIIAISNIFLSILLIKLFGGVGAAAGTAISLVLGNGVIMNWYYYRHLGINIIKFWKSIAELGRAMIVPVFVGIGWVTIIGVNSIINFVLGIILYTVLYCVCVYWIGLNTREKEQVLLLIKKL